MTSNFTCVIVDDEQDAIELLTRRISYLYKNITITGSYTAWDKALTALKIEPCDLLFMDISMPGKDGMQLLKLLPGIKSEIIFVTAHDNFALEAFSFSASGYILKPIDDEELSLAVDKALTRIDNRKRANNNSATGAHLVEKIGIPNNQGIDYIDIQDIMYLESTNKCTKIVTTKGEFVSSHNLGKFQNLVDTHSFFQVHRSYIINLMHILRYESSLIVIMANKNEIPVSRNVKSDFLKLFNDGF